MSGQKTKIVAIGHNQVPEVSELIKSYIAARKARKELDASARAMKKQVDGLRGKLWTIMQGLPVMRCDKWLMIQKHKDGAAGALTLANGTRIMLSDVAYVVTRDRVQIPVDDIETWFGGSSGSDDIEVEEVS